MYINDRFPLVEKITCRLKPWSVNLLSYAGRLQPVKSGISNSVVYWMQIFPIPKKVLKVIDGIFRSFLLSGKEIVTKKAPDAWERVCQPLNFCGLKVINLQVWNQALYTKLLCNLAAKLDKMWVNGFAFTI